MLHQSVRSRGQLRREWLPPARCHAYPVETLAREKDVIARVIRLGKPEDALFAHDGGAGFAMCDAFYAATAKFESSVLQRSVHWYLQKHIRTLFFTLIFSTNYIKSTDADFCFVIITV